MKIRRVVDAALVCLALILAGAVGAGAEVVGRFTQVEGRVDLLKGGNLPAVVSKVDDPVAARDVIRTKSLSKAQITFIDNSVLTISPESRIAIEEYMVDTTKGKRQALLEIFQGTALAVVNKIFKTTDPDFVIKTHTAIMGIRGTEIGVRIQPNSSSIMNFQGVTQVGNIFPEVSRMFPKAAKIAFAFGGWNDQSNRWVTLKDIQGTSVGRNLPPTLPFGLAPQDREMFMRHLSNIATTSSGGGGGGGAGAGAGGTQFSQAADPGSGGKGAGTTPASSVNSVLPGSANAPVEQTILSVLNSVTVPPTVVPQANAQTTHTPTPTPTPASGIAVPVFNILTAWGAGARDLDLHLTGPQGTSTFHVYYANQGSLTSQPYAKLNGDNTSTNGSEVITVQQFNQGGTYQASVFNYGNQSTTSTNLSTTSGVSLQVINGGTVVPLAAGGATVNGGTVVTSMTPTTNQAGNTWVAVNINPSNGQVTQINQIRNRVPSSAAAGS